MKLIKIYFALCCSLLYFSCNKATTPEEFAFSKFQVQYKQLVGSYPVVVSIDTTTLGTIAENGALIKILPASKEKMTLTVKKEDGTFLFDTVFTPTFKNSFMLLISDVLGVAQMYTPPATQPDAQHMRMQFFHKVVVNGVTYPKINIKLFTRKGPTGPFKETPFELKNVEFGKLSEMLELPLTVPDTIWGGGLQYNEYYYMKLYDAETGALLLDLWEEYMDGRIETMTGGATYIVDAKTEDYPPDGAFWGWVETYRL